MGETKSPPQASTDTETEADTRESTSSSSTSTSTPTTSSSADTSTSSSSSSGSSTAVASNTTELDSASSSGTDGESDICNGDVGLAMPLPECSPEDPCTYVATKFDGRPILTRSDPPECADSRWTEAPREWQMGDVERYACVYTPPDANAGGRPLVVFLHPGGEGADSIDETSLLDKAADYDLTGSQAQRGFILAAVQGRNLHFPTAAPRDGRHHDFYHRDLGSPSGNPDVAALDTLIDDLAAEANVDTDRIYVMGWSNGAFFGQLYATARHDVATAGGHRVASAAVFAAANPFDSIQRDPFVGRPHRGASCKLDELPQSDVPILLTYRSCDFATPCGAGGATCFGSEPGFIADDWLEEAAPSLTGLQPRRIGGLESGAFSDLPVGQCSTVADSCDNPPDPERPCFMNQNGVSCVCLLNHLRWPDGIYGQGSGVDNEPAMLDFLRANQL